MHKLLFDNNISHRILPRIAEFFPNSTHVMLEDLDTSTDAEIWQFAYEHTYTIVTKDSDFNDIAVFKGVPPKVIWIKLGNCRVVDIENVLKANESVIKSFIQADNSAILEI